MNMLLVPFGLNPIAQEISVEEFHRLRRALVKIFCEFDYDDLEEPLQLVEQFFEEKFDEDQLGRFVFEFRCILQNLSYWSKIYKGYIQNGEDVKLIGVFMVECLEKCLRMLEIPYKKEE